MKTFLEIAQNVAKQPWSIEDPDITDINSVEEDSPKLILAIQNANSFIFRTNDLPFKTHTTTFKTRANRNSYDTPSGSILEINCQGNSEPLRYDENLSRLSGQNGRPSKFGIDYTNAVGKINLYPVPDDTYQMTVKYKTFMTAVRDGEQIDNLELDNDVLNVPQEFEDMYLQALYNKTMVYLIADDQDENYVPYERKYQEAIDTLMGNNVMGGAKYYGY